MTAKQQIQSGATALLLVAAILLGIWGGVLQSAGVPTGPIFSAGSDVNLNSTVTIKTQKAADSIKGGIRGIDVSKYQGTINWKKVAKDDVNFTFVRASYGTVNDPKFLTNAREAHDNGLKVGAYHYATFRNSSQVKAEAAHFISRLKKVNITYPVVLDLEDSRHQSIKKSTLTKLAIQFMDLVEAEGYTVMLYSGYNFLRDHVDYKKVMNSNYDLWIANYVERPKSIDHKVWQHTSLGKVSGISTTVDINIAYQELGSSKQSSSSSGQRTPPVRDTSQVERTPPVRDTGETTTPSRTTTASSSGSNSTDKKIAVDKEISTTIKTALNKRYKLVDVSMDGNYASELKEAISIGLQYEMNQANNESNPMDGQLRREQVSQIYKYGFSKSEQSNVTYLVQARLFYLGYYDQVPSAVLDADTTEAIKAYQSAKGLEETGKFDLDTLRKLLL